MSGFLALLSIFFHKFKTILKIDLMSFFITIKMFDYIALSRSGKKISMMNFIVSKMDFIMQK